VVALAALERGSLQFTPQSTEGVTYANKIEKSETRIDWAKSWSEVHNHIRGLSPFPGAWFEAADVGRVKVLRSTRAEGAGKPGQILDDRLTLRAAMARSGSSKFSAPASSRCAPRIFCAGRPLDATAF
jgi:methionyl-tRNA formyltransferase